MEEKRVKNCACQAVGCRKDQSAKFQSSLTTRQQCASCVRLLVLLLFYASSAESRLRAMRASANERV